MKAFQIFFFLIAMVCFTACEKIFTDTQITGHVYHELTAEPIEGVEVGFMKHDLGRRTVKDQTNKSGEFKLRVNASDSLELQVFSVYESIQKDPLGEIDGINGEQVEAHELVCIDSNNCISRYWLAPDQSHVVDFYLRPTGKINFVIRNNTNPDIDQVVLQFPENSTLDELQYTATFDAPELNSLFAGTKRSFVTDESATILVTTYKNGDQVQSFTQQLRAEAFRTLLVEIEV